MLYSKIFALCSGRISVCLSEVLVHKASIYTGETLVQTIKIFHSAPCTLVSRGNKARPVQAPTLPLWCNS